MKQQVGNTATTRTVERPFEYAVICRFGVEFYDSRETAIKVVEEIRQTAEYAWLTKFEEIG